MSQRIKVLRTSSGSVPGGAAEAAVQPALAAAPASKVEVFLAEMADALNTTLDLGAVLHRIADLVKQFIDYRIFAILLVNERTQEMHMRFQIGHTPEIERLRIRLGQGVTGAAAQQRIAILANDVTKVSNYINAHPAVKSELAVPIITKNRVIGVIDIQSEQKDYFTEEHSRILSLVASRVAISIENARLYTRISRQAETLQVLNEISREVTSILNLDQLLKKVGESLSRVIDFQMFSILLLNESNNMLQHRFSVRFKENIHLKQDIPIGRGLVGATAQYGKAILVPDVSKDHRYIELNRETRSELCVPLLYKEKVIGVLDLEHTRRNYFTEEHLRTLTTLAGQIAIAVENARLYERVAKEEQRLEQDLAMAREVQMQLLPPHMPKLRKAELAAKFIPAHTIGGDMYDFFEYADRQLGIAIADVSGKGAPAALYAALVGGILRSTTAVEPTPREMLGAVNHSLNERKLRTQFVSMLYAVWDDELGRLSLANSGLPRPMFCRNGKLECIDVAGIPLGMFEDTEYDEFSIDTKPGDLFIFFSDGLTDAVNAAGEAFGKERLEKIASQCANRSAKEVVQELYDSIRHHKGKVNAFDDETVVALKVTG